MGWGDGDMCVDNMKISDYLDGAWVPGVVGGRGMSMVTYWLCVGWNREYTSAGFTGCIGPAVGGQSGAALVPGGGGGGVGA